VHWLRVLPAHDAAALVAQQAHQHPPDRAVRILHAPPIAHHADHLDRQIRADVEPGGGIGLRRAGPHQRLAAAIDAQ
jgi:hypothetical protein